MDHPSKTEGGGNKGDRAGHEGLSPKGLADLENLLGNGQEPILGQNLGRPRKPYVKQEAEIVKAAHARYRFGARMLERLIRKMYKVRISHNRIHMYLKAQGLAREDPEKKKRRKWNRYERKHSLSAGYID